MKRTLVGIFLFAMFVSVLVSASKIQPAKAQSTTIYINSDGSVSPSSAPISTVDKVTYTFTGNISYPTYNGIIVERKNSIIDGKGYTLQGNGSDEIGNGLTLTDNSNVTIENTNIQNFDIGIYLDSSSNNNTVSGNNVTANYNGIFLDSSSSNNIVSGNNATANGQGIVLTDSSNNNTVSGNNVTLSTSGIVLEYLENNNIVSGNNATANDMGIVLTDSSNNNTVSGNSATANTYGIWLYSSSSNTLYHNNFMDNTYEVYSFNSTNAWDNGYPSGGNYWSDYQTKYPGGVENDSSGNWNTPYVIDAHNTDHYPLMNQVVIPEFQLFVLMPLFLIVTLLAVAIYRKRHSRSMLG